MSTCKEDSGNVSGGVSTKLALYLLLLNATLLKIFYPRMSTFKAERHGDCRLIARSDSGSTSISYSVADMDQPTYLCSQMAIERREILRAIKLACEQTRDVVRRSPEELIELVSFLYFSLRKNMPFDCNFVFRFHSGPCSWPKRTTSSLQIPLAPVENLSHSFWHVMPIALRLGWIVTQPQRNTSLIGSSSELGPTLLPPPSSEALKIFFQQSFLLYTNSLWITNGKP